MSDSMQAADRSSMAAMRYARFVIRFRIPILLMILAATLLAAMQIHTLDLRNDPDTLLPSTNRYVATNRYGEQAFGMGNRMVWGLRIKDGHGDIYQPWFINMARDLHDRVVALDHAHAPNFIGLASRKVKHMGLGTHGELQFRPLLPVEGIDEQNRARAEAQLHELREGLARNPVLGPLLAHFEDAQGDKCPFEAHAGCEAKATFIIGDYGDGVKSAYLPWIREVRDILDEFEARYGDRVTFYTAGEPYFLAYMLLELLERWWLFALSVALVAAVLWLQFGTWRGAVFPLLGVGATLVLTLGAMGFSQFKLTTMMVLTPLLLLAVGVGHSVQITRRYLQERMENEISDRDAAERAIAQMIAPATLSIVTDMVGFATLGLVDISFYRAYAYFGMFGMLTLLLTTTTLIPLLMLTFPPKRVDAVCERGWESKMGHAVARLVMGPGKWIPIGFVAVLMALSAQYTQLFTGVSHALSGQDREFDLMPGVEKGINYARAAFKASSSPIRDLEALEGMMPGVISVHIPVRGVRVSQPACGADADDKQGTRIDFDCFNPDRDPTQGVFNDAQTLAELAAFEDFLRAHPHIGFTVSYAQFVKQVNGLLSTPPGREPLAALFHIPTAAHMQAHWAYYEDPEDPTFTPDPDQVVQLYNGLLEANADAGALDALVDTGTWNRGMIIGFVNTLDPVKTHRIALDIQQYLMTHQDDPGFRKLRFGLRNGETVTFRQGDIEQTFRAEGDPTNRAPGLGGFLGAAEAAREVAMDEWLRGPLTTALAIFIIAALMFRSFLVSGMLVFILLMTLFAQYGLGGYFTATRNGSGYLAFHTLAALSIAMGLGVDYGVYMISRLRDEMRASGRNWAQALRAALCSTGSAVVVSVFALLVCFVPLVGTELANTWALGMYIGAALIIDVALALTILPLLVYWLRPKYVFAPPTR